MKLLPTTVLGALAAISIAGCQSTDQSNCMGDKTCACQGPGRGNLALKYTGPPTTNRGFIISPYAPTLGGVDVRGFRPGTVVRCPYTGKKFRVPADDQFKGIPLE